MEGIQAIFLVIACLMYRANDVLASAERQSTASKMTIGIIAGVCTVAGIFMLLCGCYLYCCTNCCSGKQKKVHRRILPLPEDLPPPASLRGASTNELTPGPSAGDDRLRALTLYLPSPDTRRNSGVPTSNQGHDRRQSEAIPFSALPDLIASRRRSEDAVGYRMCAMNSLPPPHAQRRESLNTNSSERSARTVASSRTNDSTRTATSIGRQ